MMKANSTPVQWGAWSKRPGSNQSYIHNAVVRGRFCTMEAYPKGPSKWSPDVTPGFWWEVSFEGRDGEARMTGFCKTVSGAKRAAERELRRWAIGREAGKR